MTDKENGSPPEFTRIIDCVNRVLNLSKCEWSKNPCYNNIKNDLIAVIPAYNEELTIGMVILLSLQHVSKVIIVDDCSHDRTREIAELAGAEVIRLEKNLGKQAALRFGFERARELYPKAIITIDANGLYNPDEIPYLATLVLEGEADIVIGSRFLRNPNIISSYLFTDKQLGFVVYGEKALMILNELMSNSFTEIEISDIFIEKGLKVAEIPISVRKKEIKSEVIKKLIIALPAYNEEKSISPVIKGVLKYSNTVIVVDDGSSDNTTTVAEEAGAIVIRHTVNQGYGGALATIFSVARKMDADALITIDADGQHDPKDIRQLIEQLEKGIDVVIGSRFLEIVNEIPFYRKLGMKLLDYFTTIAGVQEITDTQSGMRAYNRKAISVIHLCGNGMSAGSEILIQISDNHLKVKEVPINVRYDVEDASTYNPVIHGISVLSNIMALINFKNPIIIFGLPAIILFILGIITLYTIFFMSTNVDIQYLYLKIVGILLLTTGIVIGSEGYIYHYYINLLNYKK